MVFVGKKTTPTFEKDTNKLPFVGYHQQKFWRSEMEGSVVSECH